MGITLGWVALVLAGATGAQPAEKNAAQISYTVKMVEAEGIGWRASVMSQLKPVTRQGSATVWTVPAEACKTLIREVGKNPAGVVEQAPRVTAFSGMPAAIQVRTNRKFVTQVSWTGEDATAHGTPEDLRVGWHTTLVGRKLDQGILVKMVFEDTEIRAVHQMPIDSLSHGKSVDSPTSGVMHSQTKAGAVSSLSFEGSPFETPECPTKDGAAAGKASCELDANAIAARKQKVKDLMDKAITAYAAANYVECEALARHALSVDPNETAATILVDKARAEKRFRADQKENGIVTSYQEIDVSSIANPEAQRTMLGAGSRSWKQLTAERARLNHSLLELPEIANQEVLGEWLIPNGECLLVSFGPHTEADKNGKAVVRERLAIIEADAKPIVVTTQRAMMGSTIIVNPATPTAILPPGAPPAVYLPHSPIFTPVPGFPPTGAPTAPPAVFVPTPEIPLPPAQYMHDDVPYFPPGPDSPWANAQAATQRARMRAIGNQPPPQSTGLPAPAAPGGPNAKLPMPAAPSRSFPEGIHVDGSKAKLPPLPDDEMDDDAAESESAEPRPSPQTKKPRKPKPAADESTTKASFVKPKSSTFFLPSMFLPSASVGFQFLLPITPLSIKLPFNQRLEIEIFGRVVPDARAAETAK